MSLDMGCGASNNVIPSIMPADPGKRSAHSKRRPSCEFRFIEHRTSSSCDHSSQDLRYLEPVHRSSSQTTGVTVSTTAETNVRGVGRGAGGRWGRSKSSEQAHPKSNRKLTASDHRPSTVTGAPSTADDGSRNFGTPERPIGTIPRAQETPPIPGQLFSGSGPAPLPDDEEMGSVSEQSFVVVQRRIRAAWDTEPTKPKEILLHQLSIVEEKASTSDTGPSPGEASAAGVGPSATLHELKQTFIPVEYRVVNLEDSSDALLADLLHDKDSGEEEEGGGQQATDTAQEDEKPSQSDQSEEHTNDGSESSETSAIQPLLPSQVDLSLPLPGAPDSAYIPGRRGNFIGAVRCHFRHWPNVQWPRKNNSIRPESSTPSPSSESPAEPLVPAPGPSTLEDPSLTDRPLKSQSRMVRSRTVDLASIASKLKSRAKAESLSPKVSRPGTAPNPAPQPHRESSGVKLRTLSGSLRTNGARFRAKMNPFNSANQNNTVAGSRAGDQKALGRDHQLMIKSNSVDSEPPPVDEAYSFDEGCPWKDIATVHNGFFNDFEDLFDDEDAENDNFWSNNLRIKSPSGNTTETTTIIPTTITTTAKCWSPVSFKRCIL